MEKIRSKKNLIGAALICMVLLGIIGGLAFSQLYHPRLEPAPSKEARKDRSSSKNDVLGVSTTSATLPENSSPGPLATPAKKVVQTAQQISPSSTLASTIQNSVQSNNRLNLNSKIGELGRVDFADVETDLQQLDSAAQF